MVAMGSSTPTSGATTCSQAGKGAFCHLSPRPELEGLLSRPCPGSVAGCPLCEMSTGLEQGPSHLLCPLKLSALGLDTQAASIVEAAGGGWVSTVLVSLRWRSFQGSGLNRVSHVSKS